MTLLVGDCRDILPTLGAGSVQCCVTSPPYWGLRDYGVSGQIGLEPSLPEYVETIVSVFAAVRRVLRDDGTLWLNMGDSYAQDGGPGWQGKNGQRADRRFTAVRSVAPREARYRPPIGLKPKDMLGMPWRVAFALQAAGWWLRSDIIWAKPNAMPESVTDRPTKSHEYLFLMAKSERYYYDSDAVREPRSREKLCGVSGWAHGPGDHSALGHSRDKGNAKTFRGGQYVGGTKFLNSHASGRDSHGNAPAPKPGRNCRTVWTVPTRPYAGAHFATFPPGLARPCVLSGSRPGDVVLDPFAGSGTTGQVAIEEGRSFVGIELNPEYVTMAAARTDVAPLFDTGPQPEVPSGR